MFLKTKCQFPLPLHVQKASFLLSELKYFRENISILQGKLQHIFPPKDLTDRWQSIHTHQSLVRSPQICVRTATPHSFIHKLAISCLHHDVFQFTAFFVI